MTITPTTLQAVLIASRTVSLRAGVAAALKQRFPFVGVEEHPGKLDVADLVAKALVKAPGLMVGVTRQMPRAPDLGGGDEAMKEITVYAVAEDMAVTLAAGQQPKRVDRDVVGHALADAVMGFVLDDDHNRWGLADIGRPEEVETKPLFTARAYVEGLVIYAVTWRQALAESVAPVDVDIAALARDWNALP